MSDHDLLAELDRRGITIKAHGDRLRYSPRSAVTPDLAGRMKAHKAALLAILAGKPVSPEAAKDAIAIPTEAVCRCGSTTWRDVPIHGGQSIRRDCDRCARFIGFPQWHGAGHIDQQCEG